VKDLFNFFEKPKDPLSFSAIRISLASPDKIREWSHGEVKKPETINYRTFKPERDGLFCAKIFGPVKDYECNCGKYKRMKHRGVVCEKCGVEVIQSKVRRERLGHISLATPVAHIWFLKSLPSRIGNLLDITLKELEKVLYCESYVVVEPRNSGLQVGELLTEDRYQKLVDELGGDDAFEARMGADAIRDLLRKINIHQLGEQLRGEMRDATSEAKRKKIAKRLKVVEAFRESTNKPEWMMLEVIPVIPPDLRPLVPLDGGRFATSDLNDLYRRVINRNNRLKRLQELNALRSSFATKSGCCRKRSMRCLTTVAVARPSPDRTSVHSSRCPTCSRASRDVSVKTCSASASTTPAVRSSSSVQSCACISAVCRRRWRSSCSSRSSTTSSKERGHVTTIKSAKKMVDKERSEVWDILEEVIREHPVLLNRAPTLHRLGIQAFEPVS
jgi:DNA-directed RNA polymerase subunit beta'